MSKRTWFTINNLAEDTAEVLLYDDIGGYGVSADQFREKFNAIKHPKIDLRINSGGGSCDVATAMCIAIREHSATVTAHVDGFAASAACTVACACDKVEIAPGAFMMIHNVMSMAFGNGDDLRKVADICDKYSDAVCSELAQKTGKSKKAVQQKMDAETWFTAQEAMDFGLADCIKDDADSDDVEARIALAICNSANFHNFKHIPEQFRLAAHQAAQRAGHRIERRETLLDEETPMLDVINRNGKSFVKIDGKEHEISPVADFAGVALVGPDPVKAKADLDAAIAKAKSEGAAEAIAYEGEFATVLATAKIGGEEATKFRAEFYRQPITLVKSIAAQLAARSAIAVGEGGAGAENGGDKELQNHRTNATKRFGDESGLRKAFGCMTNDTTSEQWKTALGRYLAAEERNYAKTHPVNA